ncbi:hypothetical protein J6TS7_35940 [Paenibacillus dendritiformis]|nr:hypothetical protein J6TS7_35940 [Paenibacillus dendritiformis]
MKRNIMHIQLNDKMCLDIEHEVLLKCGVIISLSRVEFRLLYLLAINQGQVVPFQELKNYAWKMSFTVTQHELYVYISRIRKKLDDENHIICIRNAGYMLT